MKNFKFNLKLVVVGLALVALGFGICKFMNKKHENVKIQCHGNR